MSVSYTFSSNLHYSWFKHRDDQSAENTFNQQFAVFPFSTGLNNWSNLNHDFNYGSQQSEKQRNWKGKKCQMFHFVLWMWCMFWRDYLLLLFNCSVCVFYQCNITLVFLDGLDHFYFSWVSALLLLILGKDGEPALNVPGLSYWLEYVEYGLLKCWIHVYPLSCVLWE